jgi:hypothetical protein
VTRRLLPAAALLAASFSACGNPGSDSYQARPLPKQSFALPQDVFAPILRGFPEGREGRQDLELSANKGDDGTYIVLLTISGLLDDSIGAQQHRAVLRYADGGWKVTELGERRRCRRGASGGWTTRPCS